MKPRGEITVFLALILVSVWALLCGLVESARTAGARCYMRQALDASMDSLLSQYHRRLWQKYRLLGLEYEAEEDLEQELLAFLKPYEEAQNWYTLKGQEAETQKLITLADGGGTYLEEQILKYMKYGLMEVEWDSLEEGQALEAVRSLKESESLDRVSEFYSGHTKEAVRLEQTLENLNNSLTLQQSQWQSGLECLKNLDGGGFITAGAAMERELKKVPSLVERYEKQADQLQEKLEETRKKYEAEKADLSPAVCQAVETEIASYLEYTQADGSRRQEIHALSGQSKQAAEQVRSALEEAEEVCQEIADWEPEDEDDELDEEALWAPVLRRWEDCPRLSLGVSFGSGDPEKKGLLDAVGRLASQGLLELVLPEDGELSQRVLALSETYQPQGSKERRERGILERLMLGEYELRFFKSYEKTLDESGCCAYEAEYLLYGKGSDRENLEASVIRLLAVREGMNLICILTSPSMRNEARTLAAAIAGGTGLLPFTGVISFFVMGVWALAEGLMDVQGLLDGQKVPFVKTQANWQLDLDGVLTLGKEGRLPQRNESGQGLDYKGYLRLFLMAADGETTACRMMDLIQANIQLEEPTFQLSHCAHQVDLKAAVCGKHLLFNLGLWKSQMGAAPDEYSMKMAVSGSYE